MIANIRKTEPERLGDVTVKYMAPINVHEFLAKGSFEVDSAKSMQSAALALTRTLYQAEANAQQLTLNSIIAAYLCYSPEVKPEIQSIVEDANIFFHYFKDSRNRKTNMNAPPSQFLVETHIQGLNFKMVNKGKKTC